MQFLDQVKILLRVCGYDMQVYGCICELPDSANIIKGLRRVAAVYMEHVHTMGTELANDLCKWLFPLRINGR